jgi:hypothetical protein
MVVAADFWLTRRSIDSRKRVSVPNESQLKAPGLSHSYLSIQLLISYVDGFRAST